jgi:dipeptidyl aminopeptidase/acylaminoacyl peptidase
MSSHTIAPYGTWESPVTPAAVTQQILSFGGLSVDGDFLYWLETRPQEGGRSALMGWHPDHGTIEAPFSPDVASRVNEYGGGAYRVTDGWIVYSERSDDSVRLISPNGTVRTIAAIPGCRYADFWLDRRRNRVLAVREDHRNRPSNDPEHTIVALSLDPADYTQEAGEALVYGSDFLSSPRLSPDGARIAWLEWDQPNMPWDGTRLCLAELDKAGVLRREIEVAGGPDESILYPLFSPDGTLHFCSDRNGWWNLYAWHDGTVQPIAPVAAEIGGADWLLVGRYYSFLDDGRILCALIDEGIRNSAMIADGKLVPLDIGQIQGCPVALGQGFAYISVPVDRPLAILYRYAIGEQGNVTVVAVSGAPVLDQSDISVGLPIRFPTKDGNTAHAFFYEPRNARFTAPPGERPPLLVRCHGGPTGMTNNALSLEIQWWTTRGFAVVDVNYGGSTGFGRAYRRRLNGQWGIVDVEDCIAATLYLINSGFADPGRIAITGGSAGGFTALSALAASPLFRAGSAHYAVSDPMLFKMVTHKFEVYYPDSLIGPLPAAAALYRQRSPRANAARITAPMIFFQGLDDKIVPPGLTEVIVEVLHGHRLPIAHYVFAGEGHGFRKAETLRRVLDLELGFYGLVFGFTPPGLEETVTLLNGNPSPLPS